MDSVGSPESPAPQDETGAAAYQELYEACLPGRDAAAAWVREPEDPLDQLARRILYVAMGGLVACPAARHAADRRRHTAGCGDHLSLGDVAALGGGAQRRAPRAPPAALGTLPPPRYVFPHAARIAAQLSGPMAGPSDNTAEVCLHRDHLARAEMSGPYFDIDSSITVFQELTKLRGSVEYVGTPMPVQALRGSLHVSVPVVAPGAVEPALVPLHHIPHAVFAQQGPTIVYIVLPALYKPLRPRHNTRKHPRLLRTATHAFLYDAVVYPALRGRGNDFGQHLPSSYRELELVSRADGATHGRPHRIALSPESLAAVWAALVPWTAREDGPFGGAFFVEDRKGTKLAYKDAHSAAACIGKFLVARAAAVASIETRPSPDAVEQQFMDLAVEHMTEAPPTEPPRQLPYKTLLARRCCQRNSLRFLYGDLDGSVLDGDNSDNSDNSDEGDTGSGGGEGDDDEFLGSEGSGGSEIDEDRVDKDWASTTRGRSRPRVPSPVRPIRLAKTTMYPVAQLRDAAALTSEPDPHHTAYQLGLRYVNCYSPTKEIFDAAGTYPFVHHGIPYLVHGEKEWAAVATAGKVSHSRAHIAAVFAGNRERVAVALAAAGRKDFGWRFEVRISTQLARAVQRQEPSWFALLGRQLPPSVQALAAPPPVQADAYFVVPTAAVAGFLQATTDRILGAMDHTQDYYRGAASVPQRAIALYSVLAHYLRLLVSGLPPRHAWMLENPFPAPDRPVPAQPGLGLARARERFGFAFLPQLADWETFQLREFVFETITIPHFGIVAQREAVVRYENANYQVDNLLALAAQAAKSASGGPAKVVLEHLVDLVLVEFRRAALGKLCPGLTDEHRADLAQQYTGRGAHDPVPFTLQDLRKAAYLAQCYLEPQNSNRSETKTGQALFDKIWGASGAPPAAQIRTLPFAVLAAKIRAALAAHPAGFATPEGFDDLLFCRFFQQHSAFPLPTPTGPLVQLKKARGGSRTRILALFEYHGPGLKLFSRADQAYYVQRVAPADKASITQSAEPLPRPDVVRNTEALEAVKYVVGPAPPAGSAPPDSLSRQERARGCGLVSSPWAEEEIWPREKRR